MKKTYTQLKKHIKGCILNKLRGKTINNMTSTLSKYTFRVSKIFIKQKYALKKDEQSQHYETKN